MKYVLSELRIDQWLCAFDEGRRIGLMTDGVYNPSFDRDFVAMCCGCAFQ